MQLTIKDETWKKFRELVEDIAAHRNFMKNGGSPLCQATREVVYLAADSDSLHASAGDNVWHLLIEIVSLANSELAKLDKGISYEDFCAIAATHHGMDRLWAKTRTEQQKEQAERAAMAALLAFP